jgi:RNA polymerase sigma factor (sigma-70 family)
MMPTLPAVPGLLLGEVSDHDLLSRFVQSGDHAAFRLLVWRHRRLVFGVCRRVVGNSHDAEDAAQATFLILARRAETLRGTNLAAWLARVAYRCAIRARSKQRHQQLSDLSAVPTREHANHDPHLSALLDDEVNRLPEKYRVPIVLCYFGGKTYNQVAEELNCPIGTLCGWLTRAKLMLRRRLVRRGVTLSISGLSTCLSGLSPSAVVANDSVRSITSAAVAYLSEDVFPDRATTIANGVLGMTWKWKVLPAVMMVAITLFFGLSAVAISQSEPTKGNDPPKVAAPVRANEDKKTDTDRLQGVWVFDKASRGKSEMLSMVWTAKICITGEAIRVDGFLGFSGLKAPLKGTVRLDPTAEPKRFDLTLEELDFAQVGDPLKVSGGMYPGIYRWDGDRLSICFAANPGGQRPESFTAMSDKVFGATLVKAPATFTEFPKEIQVKVVGPDGKPGIGAMVATHMRTPPPIIVVGPDGEAIEESKLTEEQRREHDVRRNLAEGMKYDEISNLIYDDVKTTSADGVAKIGFEKLARSAIIVRDSDKRQMRIASVSPASLLDNSVTVTLQPECRVLARVTCEGLTKNTDQKKDESEIYLALIKTPDDREIAGIYSRTGKLEFQLPPGDYVVVAYGSGNFGHNSTKFAVPENQSEYTVPTTIVLPPTGFQALLGKPAPELSDVVAWKGQPQKLADQKGKFVLLHFWGYWCGQCVQEMPRLMDLHEWFKAKGVTIIGVHLDIEGEVASAKAFDEKLGLYKKELWMGKDIPFPLALVRGKPSEEKFVGRWNIADKYGIQSYPTTILIDREGNVVRTFGIRDAKSAIEQIEYLLKNEKK